MNNSQNLLIAIIIVLGLIVAGGAYYFVFEHQNILPVSSGVNDRTRVSATPTPTVEQPTNAVTPVTVAPSATPTNKPTVTKTTTTVPYTPPAPAVSAKSYLAPDTLNIVSPSVATHIAVGQNITITYSVGTNIVPGDPAVVERKIVNAGTDTMNSGYVPVTVSGGTYTFDWTPNEDGKYQVLLNISHNNSTYPARSATITVGNGYVAPTANTVPSITYKYISSGNVIGSFANLPANSQIRFVSASSGQPYLASSALSWSGGSGPLSFTIPNDLPNGTYYLRVTDYYSPSTIVAQSASFEVTSN